MSNVGRTLRAAPSARPSVRAGVPWGAVSTVMIGMFMAILDSSIACATAAGPAVLIGARTVQGLGAALVVPQVFAVITLTVPRRDRHRRRRRRDGAETAWRT